MKAFENAVLRKILGSMKKEVTGDYRKLITDGLHDLCSLPLILR